MAKKDLFRDTPKHPTQYLKMSLPLPPSINSSHINTNRGGRKLTYKAKNYIRDARAKAHLEVEEQGWEIAKDSTWYYIDLVFFMPDRRIRDSHNMLKLLLDVLQGILYENDYYVLPRIQSVELDKIRPRVEFVIHAQTTESREKSLHKIR